ncbi:MAG: hypothetical protein D6772_17785 [Bacteroidetes bacterium]|nr:MAG: hypothetical protein D6772_17785 [Bacteroidota bacterium]
MDILKLKWYCLTLKVQARKESVMVSIHHLPAVIASLGVEIFPNAKAMPVLTSLPKYLVRRVAYEGIRLGPNPFVVSIVSLASTITLFTTVLSTLHS